MSASPNLQAYSLVALLELARQPGLSRLTRLPMKKPQKESAAKLDKTVSSQRDENGGVPFCGLKDMAINFCRLATEFCSSLF